MEEDGKAWQRVAALAPSLSGEGRRRDKKRKPRATFTGIPGFPFFSLKGISHDGCFREMLKQVLEEIESIPR